MKSSIFLMMFLLLSTTAHAEFYSWTDESGVSNFTEDYSSIPKKYQKKVKRRNFQQDAAPQERPEPENAVKQPEKKDVKPATDAESGKQLYGGRTRAAWRQDMDAMEAEMNGMEQRMAQLRKQIYEDKGIPRDQLDQLKKEYNDSRSAYQKKYNDYTELIEKIRKAGIEVEIKK